VSRLAGGAPVLVLGAGDVGSAVAHALHGAGFAVAIRDDPAPAHPRRGMAFADALWDGEPTLAGLRGRVAADPAALRAAAGAGGGGGVALTTLPLPVVLRALPWAALVDARMRKRAVRAEPLRGLAPLTIGLGPGFAAGDTCDIAVETSWEAPGRVLRAGPTLPLRGEPRPIAGIGRERAVYAPAAGPFRTARRIGDRVEAGEEVARIGGAAAVLRAPVAGALRGLVRDGAVVREGAKVVEVDPRGDPALCFGLGERPVAIARGVLAALGPQGDAEHG
jgi:xanthine dehydrogenase accessory factor